MQVHHVGFRIKRFFCLDERGLTPGGSIQQLDGWQKPDYIQRDSSGP